MLFDLQREVSTRRTRAADHATTATAPTDRNRLRRRRRSVCRSGIDRILLLGFARFTRIVRGTLFFCSGHNAPCDMPQPYRLFPVPHSGHTALSPRPRTIRAYTGTMHTKVSLRDCGHQPRRGHHSRTCEGIDAVERLTVAAEPPPSSMTQKTSVRTQRHQQTPLRPPAAIMPANPAGWTPCASAHLPRPAHHAYGRAADCPHQG